MIAPSIAATRLMLFLLAGAFVAMGIMRVRFAAHVMPAMVLVLARRARSHVLVASSAAVDSNAGRRKGKLSLQESEHQHGAGKHG